MWYVETKKHRIYPIRADDYFSAAYIDRSDGVPWIQTVSSWHSGAWISTPIEWVKEICSNPFYIGTHRMFAFITLCNKKIIFIDVLNIWEEND